MDLSPRSSNTTLYLYLQIPHGQFVVCHQATKHYLTLWKILLGYGNLKSHSPYGYWNFPVFSISLKYMASTKFIRVIDLQIQIVQMAVFENI